MLYESRITGTGKTSSPEFATDLLAFAPVFGDGRVSSGTQRSIGTGTLLSALPATREELNQLKGLFKEQGGRATTFIGGAATEATLLASDLNNARYLHFATHGFINNEHPDLSGLALYPDSSGTNHDNFLSVGEVYNLKLKAELVTLSACETGLGKVASGEGVLGFSRAFLYAGADNLLVSLWQVQDAATARLMVDFYGRILSKQQAGLPTNLREAKLRMLEDAAVCHPYYWSPFVLIRR